MGYYVVYKLFYLMFIHSGKYACFMSRVSRFYRAEFQIIDMSQSATFSSTKSFLRNSQNKLHKTTNVSSSGLGDAVKKLPNRIMSQGKRKTWSSTDINYELNTNISSKLIAYINSKKDYTYQYLRFHGRLSNTVNVTELYDTSLNLVHPFIEYQRFQLYNDLRKHLSNLVTNATRGKVIQPPLMTFERWQYQAKLHETSISRQSIKKNVSKQATRQVTETSNDQQLQVFIDPLLPYDTSSFNASGLLTDLSRIGIPSKISLAINKKLLLQSEKYSHYLRDAKNSIFACSNNKNVDIVITSKLPQSFPLPASPKISLKNKTNKMNTNKQTRYANIVLVENKHNCDLFYDDSASMTPLCNLSNRSRHSSELFKINYEHIQKLKMLWSYTRYHTLDSRSISCINDADEILNYCDTFTDPLRHMGYKNREDTLFYNDLYCLLVRYQALNGHGYQAAISEHVFDTLKQHLQVSVECFASPLNCNLPLYCSLFPDTDAVFGSLGSFFDFHPSEGSFQANPPFVPDIMDKMVRHIHSLLVSAQGPMSFTVIVPGWTDDAAYVELSRSHYCTSRFTVSRSDHGFVDGAQHQRQDRYRPSSYDTSIFLLQNEGGHKKWPLNDDVERSLRQSFALSMPSPGATIRRKNAGLYTID